ncbi:hypothetical protein V8C86DRAFT_2617015 [Haematococcus lacustris]
MATNEHCWDFLHASLDGGPYDEGKLLPDLSALPDDLSLARTTLRRLPEVLPRWPEDSPEGREREWYSRHNADKQHINGCGLASSGPRPADCGLPGVARHKQYADRTYKASSGSKAAKEVVKVDIFFLIFSSEVKANWAQQRPQLLAAATQLSSPDPLLLLELQSCAAAPQAAPLQPTAAQPQWEELTFPSVHKFGAYQGQTWWWLRGGVVRVVDKAPKLGRGGHKRAAQAVAQQADDTHTCQQPAKRAGRAQAAVQPGGAGLHCSSQQGGLLSLMSPHHHPEAPPPLALPLPFAPSPAWLHAPDSPTSMLHQAGPWPWPADWSPPRQTLLLPPAAPANPHLSTDHYTPPEQALLLPAAGQLVPSQTFPDSPARASGSGCPLPASRLLAADSPTSIRSVTCSAYNLTALHTLQPPTRCSSSPLLWATLPAYPTPLSLPHPAELLEGLDLARVVRQRDSGCLLHLATRYGAQLADVLAEVAQWERHGRTLVHLLLTPHCSHDAEYFSEQVAVPGDDGAWELGLLQWLLERLGQAQFQWLLARGNAASSSTALHTAARHAGERTQGLQLLEFITLHAPPDLLLARTQQSYLPYHSACRSRCRPAVSLLLRCWAQACSRSAVSPEVRCSSRGGLVSCSCGPRLRRHSVATLGWVSRKEDRKKNPPFSAPCLSKVACMCLACMCMCLECMPGMHVRCM